MKILKSMEIGGLFILCLHGAHAANDVNDSQSSMCVVDRAIPSRLVRFEINTDNEVSREEFDATFQALYSKDYSPAWGWIIGGTVAGVGLTVMTGGAATPFAASIGTLIGQNVLGLSGVAATNAGLAMLGGGSLASGGFGMAGGTLLLSGVLSFSTEITVDFATNRFISNDYSYEDLVTASTQLLPIPLPNDENLSFGYQRAFVHLKGIDKKVPILHPDNRAYVEKAICEILDAHTLLDTEELREKRFFFWESNVDISGQDTIKDQILLAILYFQIGDYIRAREFSALALQQLEEIGAVRSVPRFISAVSAMYEEDFEIDVSMKAYIAPAFLDEPDNKMIPLLSGILLDRMMLRLGDGALNISSFNSMKNIMDEEELSRYSEENYALLMARYVTRLKYNQQQISVLSRTHNSALIAAPSTLEELNRALEEYNTILVDAEPIYTVLNNGNKTSKQMVESWPSYKEDYSRLTGFVESFRNLAAQ